jgi:hypothetical protein
VNEETFLTGLRGLAELPVPGPLPEQQVIARGRAARRRRAALRTATAAAGTALAVAAAVGIPSGYFTAAPPAQTPAPTPAPLTNGETLASQWSVPVGNLAGDPDVGAGLRARARELLSRPPADVRVLVATDLDHARVALMAVPRASGGNETLWLVGPRGTRPGGLRPARCSGYVLCTVSVQMDGWPGRPATDLRWMEELNGPPPGEVTRQVVVATLVGATVTGRAVDVDDTGRTVRVDVPVGGAGTPGLFRVDDLPPGPFELVARRGTGTATTSQGGDGPNPGGSREDLFIRLADPSLRGGGYLRRPPGEADQQAVGLLHAVVAAATRFPESPGVYQPLYARRQGARHVVVLAVQSPSRGWVVVPADIVQPPGSPPTLALEALITAPAGGPSVRGFAWRTRYANGRLRWEDPSPDRVAVLGPRAADVAEVTGSSGTVRLPLVDGYAEGVVPGAGRVRFLAAHGVVVAETEVAPLLPRNGTLLPR